MRVGRRRFRAALTVFGDLLPAAQLAWLQEEAKWALNALGSARDWDVFLADLLAPLEAARPGDADLAALRGAARDRQAQAYRQLLEALASPRYTRFLLRIGGWLERSEEHTSELQSLMRISYAVFCLKKKNTLHTPNKTERNTIAN